MGQFQRKYDDLQRAAIVELKGNGLSGPKVAKILAGGFRDLDPFTISPDVVNQLYRQHRRAHAELTVSELAKLPAGEAVRTLFERAVTTAEKAGKKLDSDANRNKLDPRAFRAFTQSLGDLERVGRAVAAVQAGGRKRQDDDQPAKPEPSSFAAGLSEAAEPETPPEQIGDQRLGKDGGRIGRPPGTPTGKGSTTGEEMFGAAQSDPPSPAVAPSVPSSGQSSSAGADARTSQQGSGVGTSPAQSQAQAEARALIESAARSEEGNDEHSALQSGERVIEQPT